MGDVETDLKESLNSGGSGEMGLSLLRDDAVLPNLVDVEDGALPNLDVVEVAP